ncbi:MAG: InlB B-repeat-containing protein, partial [Solobacterium sp.]|nr:InlB B-repeat-containing protein [Solobacterium sp.]
MKAFKRILAAAMAVNMLANYPPVLTVMANEGETTDEQEAAGAVEEVPEAVEQAPAAVEEPAPEPEPEPVYEEPVQEYEEPVYVEETPAEEGTYSEPEEETQPEEQESEPEEAEESEEQEEETPEPEERTLTFEVVGGFGYVVLDTQKDTESEVHIASLSQTVSDASQFITVWAVPADGYEVDYWELNEERYADTQRVKVEANDISLDQDYRYVVHFRKKTVVEDEEKRLNVSLNNADSGNKFTEVTKQVNNYAAVTIVDNNDVLPEGTTVEISPVSEDLTGIVKSFVNGEIGVIKAVDITFYDAEGAVYRFNEGETVNVTIKAFGMNDTSTYKIIHIAGDGSADFVTEANSDGGTVIASFAAGDFSVYAIVEEINKPDNTKRGDTKGADDAEPAPTYTVTFYDRDAQVHETVEVVQGEAIGDQLPGTIAREDYTAYWAVGEIVQGAQGPEIRVTGARIDSIWKPTGDTTIVPDYDLVKYTVTFYTDDTKTETVSTAITNVNTNYCVNDIPNVPTVEGSAGKWVYGDGSDFSNSVVITSDTDVWAAYDKKVFTVTFTVDGETYQTDTYYYGDTLTLPENPVVEGKQFTRWVSGETEYVGGETVTSDLTIAAEFTDMYYVTFIINHGDGTEEKMSQYYRTDGEPIGTLPQDPFVAGKEFEKWVDQDTGEEVTEDTIVNRNITAVAQFRSLSVYNLTAEYYYINDSDAEVVFNTDLHQVEAHELPYTITAPSSTKTDSAEVSGGPLYYPETPTITVNTEDFDDQHKYTVRFKYVPYTAVYDFVYLLKDLDGEGYTEIPNSREIDVQGVLNSYVTPTVKVFDNAELEEAVGATITTSGLDGEEKQELTVKYTRKNLQLTYDTKGGSYVAGVTVPYGTEQPVTTTVPTRTGYTFAGWYTDEQCTNPAGSTVMVDKNTTLYAKWTGDTVDYTIVYLFEKYNDTGTESSFVYDNSETGHGQVGTTVRANDSGIPEKSKTGWEKDNTKNAASSVVIAADGSSVLYVYYKLREYTFQFNAGTYRYNYNNYNVEATLTGKGVTGTGQLNYTMTVKLGQDISSIWPGNVTGRYDSGGWWWSDWHNVSFNGWLNSQENTRYVTKRTIVTPEMLPNNGTTITYTAQWTGSAYTYTVNYWLQNADDDDYTKSEEYSQTYTSSGGNLGAKEIAGYTYDHGNSGQQGVTQYDFYYNRDTFKIDYYYGSNLLDTISSIKFDANINKSPYVWTPTAAQCGVDNDYTFDGWYSDSGLTTKYTFNKMPAANVVLYAKWTAPTYTVSFVDGEDTSVHLADNQEVEKNNKATTPDTPSKTGYIFDGWYTSAEGDDLFDWNTQIVEDTTVYAHWTHKALSYVVHYVDEDGNIIADDKEVSNPNFVVGQTITEQAIAIANYRPTKNSQTLTLSDDDTENEITFIYGTKAESTEYKVRYVIAEGETGSGSAVAQEKTVKNVPGDTASVIEFAETVDYDTLYAAHPELEGIEFFPDEVEKTLILTANKEENVLTFYYSSFKNAKVTVNFVDMNGVPIPGYSADTQIMKVGKTFTLSRTPIAGWELNKTVEGTNYSDPVAGTDYKITEETTADGLTFTLFYQKKATVTVKGDSKQYDGTVLTLPETLDGQVKVEGLLDGDSLTSVEYTYYNADSTEPYGRLNAGVATVTPKNAVIGGTHAGNNNYYTIRYISGTLEVLKINVTVRIEPDRWMGAPYTGKEYFTGFTNPDKGVENYIIISHQGYKNAYLNAIWDAVKAKATYDETIPGLHYYGIAEKDAGNYNYDIALTLADLPENDNYSVNLFVRPGRLQILPKEVVITTGSAEKTYDGTPLTNDEASITGLVIADEGKVTVTATGSQTDVGEGTNTYEITWGDDVKPDNYKIKEELGLLTVNQAELTITINDRTLPYNGQEQFGYTIPSNITGTRSDITTQDYTVSGLAEGDVLSVQYAPAEGTIVGTYKNGEFKGITISRGDEGITEFYKVTSTPGTLEVTKKTVTITADSDTKVYDGTALTKNSYQVSGLATGDSIDSVTVTGSQTVVGSSANVPSAAKIVNAAGTDVT